MCTTINISQLRNLWVLAFALLNGQGELFAQAEKLFELKGKVIEIESGLPIPYATLEIHETHATTITDDHGMFVFAGVKAGSYHLHIACLGYRGTAETVAVGPDEIPLEIKLEKTSIELSQITIEANVLKSNIEESSVNIKVVNEEFLRKNQTGTLANTLTKMPGIDAINTGVGIAKPVIRGMSANRVMVNDHGIKQEGQQWGSDHGLEVDQYNIDKVEVIKGPSALIYGSDAITGVINLLPPAIPKESTLTADLLTFYRSNNHLAGITAALEGNFNSNHFGLRFTEQHFGDYRVPVEEFTYNSFVLPIENEQLKNTAGNERNFSGNVGFSRSWGKLRFSASNFHQEAGLFAGAIGIPRTYQLEDDGDSRNIDVPRQVNNHFKSIANLKLLLKKGWLHTDIGFQRNDRQEETLPHGHGNGPQPIDSTALQLVLQTYTLNSRYYLHFSERLKTIYGISFQGMHNSSGGFEFLVPDYKVVSSGGYVFLEFIKNEVITYNAGLRFDYGNIQASQHLETIWENASTISGYEERSPEINRNHYNVSASAGLSWHINRKVNIKFNAGRTFRMPSPVELAANGIHHGTFRHEKGDPELDSEVGYGFDFGSYFNSEKFLFSLTPYFNFFENYIYLRPAGTFSPLPDAGQIYQYTQARAVHAGFETQLEYHPVEGLHMSVGADYVYNLNLETGLPLAFTPPFKLSGEAEYTFYELGKRFEDLFFGMEAVWVNAQNWVDRNEPSTEGYYLLHFNTGVNVLFGKQEIGLLFSIKNLVDAQYQNHLSRYRILNLPEPGRNYSLSLNVPFTLLNKSERK